MPLRSPVVAILILLCGQAVAAPAVTPAGAPAARSHLQEIAIGADGVLRRQGRARRLWPRLRYLDRRRRTGRRRCSAPFQEILGKRPRPPFADLFLLARRQSRPGAGNGRDASGTACDRQGGADSGSGMRLRSPERRGLPQGQAIRPRTPWRSLDPQRDVQLRLSRISSSALPPARSRRMRCWRFIRQRWCLVSTAECRLRRCGPQQANAGLARADRMLREYLAKMGAELGLLALASTIKYEDMHVLTREQIDRFGIDRREVVETPWTFENSAAAWCTRPRFRRLQATDRSVRRSGGCSASMPTNSNWICSARPWPRRSFPRHRFRVAVQNHFTSGPQRPSSRDSTSGRCGCPGHPCSHCPIFPNSI